jgi:hypothetical protein
MLSSQPGTPFPLAQRPKESFQERAQRTSRERGPMTEATHHLITARLRAEFSAARIGVAALG